MPMLRWVDLTEIAEAEIQTYLNLPCDGIILTPKQYHMIEDENNLHNECAVSIESKSDIEEIKSGIIILSSDVAILDAAREKEHRTGLFVSIKNAQDLLCAANLGPLYNYVYVQFYDETNIPLELLIATFQKYPSLRLFKYVHSSQEAEVVRSVMETGCSGVVIKSSDISTVNQYLDGTNSIETENIELVEAEITGIYHIGAGERACVDTTSLLKPNEGLLVGSTAKGGILVSSETHFLPYMNLRPFRVNAGAIHSYVWNNETTAYLSELKSGDSIWVVDTKGNARKVCVGRIKIETRPLLKIEAKIGDTPINLIVQDDWHIRVLGAGETVFNATSLKPGDKVMACKLSGSRHVGIQISEQLVEK